MVSMVKHAMQNFYKSRSAAKKKYQKNSIARYDIKVSNQMRNL